MQRNIFHCNDYHLSEDGIVVGSGSAVCITSRNKWKKKKKKKRKKKERKKERKKEKTKKERNKQRKKERKKERKIFSRPLNDQRSVAQL